MTSSDASAVLEASAAALSGIGSQLPSTLEEAMLYFADPVIATKFFSTVRWADGAECPYCRSKEKHSYLTTRHIWKCKSCRKQFSPKAETILEDSPLGLKQWLTALWIVANSRGALHSAKLHRSLGVTRTTAKFMLQRIRQVAPSESEAEPEGTEFGRFLRLVEAVAGVSRPETEAQDSIPQPALQAHCEG
ncbi:MAG: IS1595 family transposase [Bryobacteraceae bacterium]